ncbi:PAS domain-containing sensor histidine kinase [Mucilaginibacter sp. 21P]|uniref:PAS domain-containing sensor histidine kinase n=1 Tax=Mucilaginibacter sp. 21P TaxID=2778902 RepID=UPI001C5875C2|nr:PAS domain-containing sensor histidine kinase [Mucilaginibacter sp. 21P]QXV64362.1 PAS domain-containing sensor histidine kinase [Mucilaginibacter sp. 21P]
MPEKTIPQPLYHKYLEGGGEMGERIRTFDWSATTLGTPDTWPQSLLLTVSTMLRSRFPMFLFWGRHHIQFYNDAYRPSLGASGKHPSALGRSGKESWQEIWSAVEPQIERSLHGESTYSENELVPMFRDGKIDEVYWTYSYSPVITEDGTSGGALVICHETTTNVKALKTIDETATQLQFAIEAAELGTWELDPKTNRFVANKRVADWFGLPHTPEIALSSAIEAIVPEDRERVSNAIIDTMKPGSDGNYDISYTVNSLQSGERRVVRAKGKVIFDQDGEATRFSGTLQDITDDVEIEKRKDEFISVASHELKTPITSLNASLQILQKLVKTEPVSDKFKTFTAKAGNNLNKLVHLLDDLLNVTKIQQGQLALSKNRFNLSELVRDSCDHISQGSDHEISINGTDELFVYADYRRIDQVLVNFVGNAIKYSPQSKKIDITLEQVGSDARVIVKDYGIGINPEKLPHLFDRYYRVDALGHQFSGLGLGLYISSDIIKRHDGNIGVESQWGEGSQFWFTLPID